MLNSSLSQDTSGHGTRHYEETERQLRARNADLEQNVEDVQKALDTEQSANRDLQARLAKALQTSSDESNKIYLEVMQRLYAGSQKSSYMQIMFLLKQCVKNTQDLRQNYGYKAEEDDFFKAYCQGYREVFYKKATGAASTIADTEKLQDFTTQVAALCCLDRIFKSLSANVGHDRYKQMVIFVAEATSDVTHVGLYRQIKQDTEYEKMVHKMSKTLHDFAKSDVKACILYDNPSVSNTDLLELLKDGISITGNANRNQTVLNNTVLTSISAPDTLRPFAGVRLRFI